MRIRSKGRHGPSEGMLRPLEMQAELAGVIIQDRVFEGMGNDQQLANKNADQNQNQSDASEIHVSAFRIPSGIVIHCPIIVLVCTSS